jgi:hypothetical protein
MPATSTSICLNLIPAHSSLCHLIYVLLVIVLLYKSNNYSIYSIFKPLALSWTYLLSCHLLQLSQCCTPACIQFILTFYYFIAIYCDISMV